MRISPVRPAYLLLGLGVVLTAAGALAIDAARGILNGEAMADRTAAALDDPRVGAFVADRLTNAVLAEKPDLVAFRPIIAATAGGLVETAPFRAIVRSAVRTAHRSALSTTGQRVLVSLPDVGVLVQSAVQSMSPEMADKIPPRIEAFASDLDRAPGHWTGSRKGLRLLDFLVAGRRWRSCCWARSWSSWASGSRPSAAGPCCAPASACWSPPCCCSPSFPRVARWRRIISQEALERGAIAGSLARLFHRTRGLGHHARRHRPAGDGRRDLAARSGRPDPPRGTAVPHPRDATQDAGPGPALVARHDAGRRARGGLTRSMPPPRSRCSPDSGVCYIGLRELFRLVLGALPEETAGSGGAGAKAGRPLAQRAGWRSCPCSSWCSVAPSWRWRGPGSRSRRAARWSAMGRRCSATAGWTRWCSPPRTTRCRTWKCRNWMFPQQNGEHPAAAAGRHSRPADRRAQRRAGRGHRAHRSRRRGPVGHEDRARRWAIRRPPWRSGSGTASPASPAGRAALYLCHGFCEIGSRPLVPELEEIRNFLRGNPEEVLVMVIEDYAPPETIAADFEKTGLAPVRVSRPDGAAAADAARARSTRARHSIVFLESGTPGVPWLLPGVRRRDHGDTVHLPRARPVFLQGQPRRQQRAAVPDQPLDRVHARHPSRATPRSSTATTSCSSGRASA